MKKYEVRASAGEGNHNIDTLEFEDDMSEEQVDLNVREWAIEVTNFEYSFKEIRDGR